MLSVLFSVDQQVQIWNPEMIGQRNLLFIFSIQSRISPDPWHLPIVNNNLASLTQFQTNISAFCKLISQIKSSTCVLDIIPTKF